MIDGEEIFKEFSARVDHLAKNTMHNSKEFLHTFKWGGKLMLSVCLKFIRKQQEGYVLIRKQCIGCMKDCKDCPLNETKQKTIESFDESVSKDSLRVLRDKIKEKFCCWRTIHNAHTNKKQRMSYCPTTMKGNVKPKVLCDNCKWVDKTFGVLLEGKTENKNGSGGLPSS